MFLNRNYPSNETYDLGKMMDFITDNYDVISSPLLNKLKDLPVYKYYDVNEGYKELDQISQEVYSSPFYTFYIMYYNDLQTEIVEEGTVLKLFSLVDLGSMYYNISKGIL